MENLYGVHEIGEEWGYVIDRKLTVVYVDKIEVTRQVDGCLVTHYDWTGEEIVTEKVDREEIESVLED